MQLHESCEGLHANFGILHMNLDSKSSSKPRKEKCKLLCEWHFAEMAPLEF